MKAAQGKSYAGSDPQKTIRAKCFRSSHSFIKFEKKETEQSIPDRFEQIVAKYPDRVAVKTRNHTLTYDELNEAGNRVARAILSLGRERERPIALFLDHDAPMIAAILGVLKAGGIYVPVDPAFPHSRSAYMLEDSQAGLMITSNKSLSRARELAGDSLELLNIDEIHSSNPAENPLLPMSPDTVAYILYTSGSTGKPKGVFQNHRNILRDVMQYTNALCISSADRMTLLYSYSVNGAVRGIFGALLNGAALYPMNVRKDGFTSVAAVLIEEQITIYHSVPTVFRGLADALTGMETFPALRVIRFGGERVLAQDVELYKKYFSDDCVLYTGMGSTETGHVCEYFIDKDTQITENVVPTGYPVADKDVLLLDDAGEARSSGVGEIAVKSRYLSLGYWRRPELTQAVFRSDPVDDGKRIYRTGDLGRIRPDGCLEHLGRKDFQVKVRGFRVEVGETEMALLDFPGIKEAVVLAREDPSGEQQLVGYVVSGKASAPSSSELRSFLKDRLPDYMVPSAFVTMDALPLTPNGKVDRPALPPPDFSRRESKTPFAAPQDAVELRLSKIWEKALGIHPVGVRDNFFDLGGHSVLAVRLIVQIEKIFGTALVPAALFQSPTIEQLAATLRQGKCLHSWSSLLPIQPDGARPPFFWVHGDSSNIFLPSCLGPDQPLYALEHQSQDGIPARHTQIETIAAHYLTEIRTIQPEGPYFLGGYSFGGSVAFEMAQQLTKQGEGVSLLFLLDSHFPGRSIPEPASGSPKRIQFRSETKRHLREFVLLSHRPKLAYVVARVKGKVTDRLASIREILERILYKAHLVAGRPIPASLRSLYILDIYDHARRNYVPLPYPGRAVYVKCTKRSDDYRLNWATLMSGGMESHEVPGKHSDMIKETSVQMWAELLRTFLR